MSALPAFEHATQRAGYRVDYAQKLRDIGATVGLLLDHKPTRRVRGWPQPSMKPWHILYSDGTLVASFKTLDGLERNLRARAGC